MFLNYPLAFTAPLFWKTISSAIRESLPPEAMGAYTQDAQIDLDYLSELPE